MRLLSFVSSTLTALALVAIAPLSAEAQSACDENPGSYDCWAEGQTSTYDPTQCATPTAAQCRDGAYNDSYCGAVNRDWCNAFIDADYRAATASISTTARAMHPDGVSSPGAIQTVKSVPYDPSNDYLWGYGATYSGKVLNRRPAGMEQRWSAYQLTPQQRWEANGDVVTSCEEYAYEKYWDWSRFEDATASYAADSFAVFNTLMSDGTGTRDGEINRRGYGTGWVFSMGSLPGWLYAARTWGPKNAYFAPAWDGRTASLPHPTSGYVYQYDARIAGWLGSGGKSWTMPTDWERLRTAGLAITSTKIPAQLDVERDQQRDYAALWDARSARYFEWMRCRLAFGSAQQSRQCHGGLYSVADVDQLYSLLLYWADMDIERALLAAQARGCLDPNSLACELVPGDFVRRLTQLVRDHQEVDYQRCVKLTHNDFSSTGLLGTVAVEGFPDLNIPKTDFRLSNVGVDLFFEKIENWMLSLPFPKDPKTKQPVLGDMVGDSSSIGTSFIGADFGYYTGWSVWDFAFGREVWQAQAQAYATAYASANVLGQYVDVFNASASVWTQGGAGGDSVQVAHSVRVLGQNLYEPVYGTINTSWNPVIDQGRSQDLAGASTYIVVVCIPIRLSAGLTGSLGVRGSLGGSVTRNAATKSINLATNATITPYARLSGFLDASVSAGVVSVGIRGEINLLTVEVPFVGTLAIEGGGSNVKIRGDMGAELVLRTLDGRVVAYVDYWLDDAEYTLFQWGGAEERTRLFHTTLVNAPMSMVKLAIESAK